MHTGFWREIQKERDQKEDKRRWEDNIKMDFRDIYDGAVWTGFIWLRIGISGGIF
jgi:hypothetical protein